MDHAAWVLVRTSYDGGRQADVSEDTPPLILFPLLTVVFPDPEIALRRKCFSLPDICLLFIKLLQAVSYIVDL